MKYKYKTRWLRKKELDALEKIAAYLNDERKEYEALQENGEPTTRHIGKALKIINAYIEEVNCSVGVIGSALGDLLKRDFRAGKPYKLPEVITVGSSKPNLKRPIASAKGYEFKESK